MRDIGKNIKTLRVMKNMTQEELSELLFVTRQTVSNYENGKSRPDVDMIIKIAEVLDADVNAVIYGMPTPPDRKKAYIKLGVCYGLLVILAVLYLVLAPIAEQWRYNHFRTGLQDVLIFYVRPLMLMFFGWGILHGLSLALQFKELSGRWVKISKWALVATTALIFISTLPWMIFVAYGDYLGATTGSVMLSSPKIPVISDIMWFTMMMDAKAPAVYALIGGALRLFRFPK